MTKITLPIITSEPYTAQIANCRSLLSYYLIKSSLETNPLERIKWVIITGIVGNI